MWLEWHKEEWVCSHMMRWSWNAGKEAHHKTGHREDHVTAFKKKDPQAIMISPELDALFSTNSINSSLCSPPTLKLKIRKMRFNEPLVSLNIFQAKSTQFMRQGIFFSPFFSLSSSMLPAVQMQPGIRSLMLRAQISSPVIKISNWDLPESGAVSVTDRVKNQLTFPQLFCLLIASNNKSTILISKQIHQTYGEQV